MRRFVASIVAASIILTGGFVSASNVDARDRSGLQVTVYNYRDLSQHQWERTSPWRGRGPTTRPCINTTFANIFDFWGEGSLGRRCNIDDFLVRYQGYITVPSTADYTFYTVTDDGFRLEIGSSVVINDWQVQSITTWNATSESITLIGGERYNLDAWLFENGGGAGAMLYYSVGAYPQEVPPSWFSHR